MTIKDDWSIGATGHTAAHNSIGRRLNQFPNPQLGPILTQRQAMAKGGVIGTDGKAVIALRFDDGFDAFTATVLPLLVARGLPAGMALISRFLTAGHWWSQATTWDDIRNWVLNGVEIWSHSTDHKDPTPGGYGQLYREIVESKQDIEDQEIKCQGWIQPGVTPLTDEVPYGNHSSMDYFTTDAGRLITNTYGLSEMYIGGVRRHLVPCTFHGLNHITIDSMTAAEVITAIDATVARGLGLEFMLHPQFVNDAGRITTADLTAVLDHIVARRDAGDLEVLTPSGLFFADKRTDYRYNIINDPYFEKAYPTGLNSQTDWLLHTTHTVSNEGGRTAGYLRTDTDSAGFSTRRLMEITTLMKNGEVFVAEMWARRADPAVAARARMAINNYPDTTLWSLTKQIMVTADWQRVRFAFGTRRTTADIQIGIGRDWGGAVDICDVNIWKV